MAKFDWKAVLSKVAPAIATGLGGPMAGVAVSMATKALGVENGDEGALAAAVASADPHVLVQLKQVDNEFRLEIKRMGLTLEQISADDRKSAREMAVATSLTPQIILAAVYTVGYFGMIYALFTGKVDISSEQMQIAGPLIGVMTAAQVQIMNFFYGSSAGSKQKNNLAKAS